MPKLGYKYGEEYCKAVSERLKGNKHRVGKTPWNKGLKGVQVVGDETRKKLSEARKGNTNALGKKHRYKRDSTNSSGDKHYNWKGGHSREMRSGPEYAAWRFAVYTRDKFTCQMCGACGTGIRLNADHIKPWSQYPEHRYDIDNGRTLCVPCHKTTPTYGVKMNALLRNLSHS